MGGRRRLSAGAPRLLGRHDGLRGRAYRRCFNALAAEFSLTTDLARLEAGRVAAAWVGLQAALETLEAARRARENANGRRPGPREIRALERRVGLADSTYASALDHLREMVAEDRRRTASAQPADILHAIRRRTPIEGSGPGA